MPILADFTHRQKRTIIDRQPDGYLCAWSVPRKGPTSERLPLRLATRTKLLADAKHQAREAMDYFDVEIEARAAGRKWPKFKPTPYKAATKAATKKPAKKKATKAATPGRAAWRGPVTKADEDLARRAADSMADLPASLQAWGERERVAPKHFLETVPRMLGLYGKMQTKLQGHIGDLQRKDLATPRLAVLLPWVHKQWGSKGLNRHDVTSAFDAIVSDLLDAGELRRVYVAGAEYLIDPDVKAPNQKGNPQMATKKKATKKKATKKKATKKKATKKKATKKKATKKKATKKKATAPKKKATKKKGSAPEWLTELKRGDRFRELSNKKIAIFSGYAREGSGYVVSMKDTGANPMTYKVAAATLQKFFKKIASRKATEPKKADGAKGSGETARERAIRKWLK